MMDYETEPCGHCGESLVIYHQYIGDGRCEGCGEWRNDEESDDNGESNV